MNPVIVYDGPIKHTNPLHGQWVRPEDVEYYEEGIEVFDLFEKDLRREAYVLNLYLKQDYNGNLNLLFFNLGEIGAVNNKLIYNIGKERCNCRQRCESAHTCHLCDRAVRLPHLQYKVLEKEKVLKEKMDEYQKQLDAHKAQEDATSDENWFL